MLEKKSGAAGVSLEGTTLKKIAVLSMLVDHAGVVLFSQGSQAVYLILRILGRIAFPIYAFLLVEGFFCTSDRWRYGRNLLLFALISELPFNLALSGSLFYAERQNVFFTLCLGLGMLMLLKEAGARKKLWLELLTILGAAVAALLLRADYDLEGIVLILLFFLSFEGEAWGRRVGKRKGKERMRSLLGPALVLLVSGGLDSLGILALPLILVYNGERKSVRSKFLFYGIYPAHLLLLGLIRYYLFV